MIFTLRVGRGIDRPAGSRHPAAPPGPAAWLAADG